MNTLATLATQARAREALRQRVADKAAAAYDAAQAAVLAADTETVQLWQTGRCEAAQRGTAAREAQLAQLDIIRHNVKQLRRRHTEALAQRAGVSQAAVDKQRSTQTVYLSWRNSVTRSQRLSYSQRDLLRFILNSEQRYRLYSELAQLDAQAAPETVRVGTDRSDTYGMVTAREARVNTRGAYGKRGIKGTAAMVTQRDAHTPALALRPLQLAVGHATIPAGWNAEAAQLDTLTEALRRDPSLCTVRVIPGAPWVIVGQTIEKVSYVKPAQALPLGQIVPVSVYRSAAATAAEAAAEAEALRRSEQRARSVAAAQSVAAARLARDLLAQREMGTLHNDAA